MVTCPAGHDSSTTDYCDVCGAPMDATTLLGTAVQPPTPPPAAVPGGGTCANCGAEKDGRFCEVCGHDGAAPVPAASAAPPASPSPAPTNAASWVAVVRADRAWFDEVQRRDGPDAAGLLFPAYCPDRRFPLAGPQLAIGRRSRSRGIEPEIDLSGPPLDPGISALHAVLVPHDGGWAIVDLDSTNGTSIGDATTPIVPHRPVPLADGTRIRIGAWTTITIQANP